MTESVWTVRMDEGQMAQLLADADGAPERIRRLACMAINKVAKPVQGDVARAISAKVNLTQAELRRRNVYFHPAIPREGYRNFLMAEINLRSFRIPFGYVGLRPDEPNPRAQRRLAGSSHTFWRGARTTVAHSFTARVGERTFAGMFLRKGAGRLPIVEPRSPLLAEVALDLPELDRDTLEQRLGDKLEAELARLGDVVLRKGGGG